MFKVFSKQLENGIDKILTTCEPQEAICVREKYEVEGEFETLAEAQKAYKALEKVRLPLSAKGAQDGSTNDLV